MEAAYWTPARQPWRMCAAVRHADRDWAWSRLPSVLLRERRHLSRGGDSEHGVLEENSHGRRFGTLIPFRDELQLFAVLPSRIRHEGVKQADRFESGAEDP